MQLCSQRFGHFPVVDGRFFPLLQLNVFLIPFVMFSDLGLTSVCGLKKYIKNNVVFFSGNKKNGSRQNIWHRKTHSDIKYSVRN